MLKAMLALWQISKAVCLAFLLYFFYRLDHHIKEDPLDELLIRQTRLSVDPSSGGNAVRERIEPTGSDQGPPK